MTLDFPVYDPMHDSSGEHLRCAVGFKQLKLNLNTIQDALRENSRLYIQEYNEKVHLNRRFMQLPIRATVFLSKQELAFRGHREGESSSNRGNFKELLTDCIAVSPADIQEHYKKIAPVFSANSKTIQNELINCISDYIQSFIEKEIKDCDFISIQVDDTTDICQYRSAVYVVTGGIVKERFLGFFDVSSDRSADTLFNIVLNCLDKYDCRSKLVGQCYDGASVMAGHLNGLQAKIKEIAPQAIFVHCLAHRLNLVLQQSYNISRCRIFFANILDNILMQIITRFEDVSKIKFVGLLDTENFKHFSENFPMDKLQNLKEFYPDIFTDTKLHRLKSELQIVYASEEYNASDPQTALKLLSDSSHIFRDI
ncbi:hypothetical protein NQ315_011366 [Exocentrus adspersus]|uniref:DUF4371 domain-containing protein n=1 Tax=Exocentrus adspersus TaxID=1586481 RepID=A0AAV8V8R6_9CUCU|nr:hypothetical protein NQ315_011366 [Exocentrus adspersus]